MWPAFLAFATVHTFLTGWTTSLWHIKCKPFHLHLVRFVLIEAGNVTSKASLWCGEDTTFSGASFQLTFCWVWLCACLEPELSLLHLITCSGSGLSGCAVVCRLSGERRFPFTCTPANIVLVVNSGCTMVVHCSLLGYKALLDLVSYQKGRDKGLSLLHASLWTWLV